MPNNQILNLRFISIFLSSIDSKLDVQNRNCNHWAQLDAAATAAGLPSVGCSKVFASLEDIFEYLDDRYLEPDSGDSVELNVLITGSLYLVGAVTELLEHQSNYKNKN